MTIGDKLAKLRKENNYTQEQLADVLGVSRQSVSKWESDISYPETDKLIKISKIFNCSLDYLLKDEEATIISDTENNNPEHDSFDKYIRIKRVIRERKSDKIVFGMPLWHIGKNAKGFIAIGLKSTGIISIGLFSKGIISLGLLSIGLLSLGCLSLGLLSLGLFALGLISVGCFSCGILACGAICFGVVSLGAIAIGQFSLGALSIGKYLAVGDYAKAMIALGDTKAVGEVIEIIGKRTPDDIISVKEKLDTIVPSHLVWIKDIVKQFLF